MDNVSNPASCCWASAELSMRLRIVGSNNAVHTKYAFLYRLREKSAIKQSTICDSGDKRYIASMSGFGGLLSSIFSISTAHQPRPMHVMRRTEYVLAIFSLRMSSSLTTLSRILLLSVSTTKTFHWDALVRLPRAGGLGLHHHGLCSLWCRQ